MKIKNLLLFFFVYIATISNAQVHNKLGIIFDFNGPLVIRRNTMENIPRHYPLNTEQGKYYDAIKAMGNDNINPQKRIIDFYLNGLKEKGINYILIEKQLNEINFPKLGESKKLYPLNMQTIKKEYNLDQILIVHCHYGFEFENLGFIASDKRTNILLINSLVNTNDNSIIKNFLVRGIKNIKKNGLLNPPTFPNIEASMDRLLNDTIFPSLTSKLQKLTSQ